MPSHLNPNARQKRLYNMLPGTFFKNNTPHTLSPIEDRLPSDKEGPLARVRFDASLSFRQRCIEMYNAIVGTHYPHRLAIQPNLQVKELAPPDASIFSDFCSEDWIFRYMLDVPSAENAKIFLYFPSGSLKEYQDGIELENQILYTKTDPVSGEISSYTVKGLHPQTYPVSLPQTADKLKKLQVLRNTAEKNGHIERSKVIQLHRYHSQKNTIECQFLSRNNDIENHIINLADIEQTLNKATNVAAQSHYADTFKKVFLPIADRQAVKKKGQRKRHDDLAKFDTKVAPPKFHIRDEAFDNEIAKKCILGYLCQQQRIQVERKTLRVLGQKGILDYLLFPLLARKLYHDITCYQNKKAKSWHGLPIQFMVGIPLILILTAITLLLEILRMLSGFALTLICAVTIVPILHYQLQYPAKNESKPAVDSSAEIIGGIGITKQHVSAKDPTATSAEITRLKIPTNA